LTYYLVLLKCFISLVFFQSPYKERRKKITMFQANSLPGFSKPI
ncbi:unnamed protein product, partial [Allacma fusca]